MTWLISKALLSAFENSHSLPGEVAESSEGSYSDGEQSAQLNMMPTQHPFWRSDRTMDALSLSQFGQTCAALTEDRGEELLKSFRAAFPARTFQQPDAAKESQAHEADCGQKWRGLLAKYDHDTRSWKTAQCSLLGDLEQSLETWPRSGLMLNGVCYQRQTLARSICAKESGFSPDGVTTFHTPTTLGLDGGSNIRMALKRRTEKGNWPTPTANDSKNSTLPESQRNRDGMAGSLLRQGHQPGETLNPEWVEWLMNWPIGWTSLEPMNAENWERWKSANAAYFESNGAIETWCNNDPSESQHDKVPRVTTGVASRAERLKALGNGQFPRTAAEAWDLLLAPANTAQAATKGIAV